MSLLLLGAAMILCSIASLRDGWMIFVGRSDAMLWFFSAMGRDMLVPANKKKALAIVAVVFVVTFSLGFHFIRLYLRHAR